MGAAREALIEERGPASAGKILTILVDALVLTSSTLNESPLMTVVSYCQDCLEHDEPDMIWAALAAADAWRNGH